MLAPLLVALVLAVGQAGPDPAADYRHVGPTPPPHGYPVIKAMHLSTTDIHVGHPISGTVVTSENVHYVEARINYRNVPLHQDAPGKFSLIYTVPWWLPPWLRHPYTLQVIARSIDGVEAVRGIPVQVH